MLRGCGGGTGGSLGGAGGGGGAVPTALQLLWSSLAPHPVEEMPLLLKEGENAPLLSGKVPPKGGSPPLIPLERVDRGAPSIQVFLVSPRVVTKDNLCVQFSVQVYCVVSRAPATELLAGILPKILGDPNRDCKGLVIHIIYYTSHHLLCLFKSFGSSSLELSSPSSSPLSPSPSSSPSPTCTSSSPVLSVNWVVLCSSQSLFWQ